MTGVKNRKCLDLQLKFSGDFLVWERHNFVGMTMTWVYKQCSLFIYFCSRYWWVLKSTSKNSPPSQKSKKSFFLEYRFFVVVFYQIYKKEKRPHNTFESCLLLILCGLEKHCGIHVLNISTSKVMLPAHEAALMAHFVLVLWYIRQPWGNREACEDLIHLTFLFLLLSPACHTHGKSRSFKCFQRNSKPFSVPSFSSRLILMP